MKGNKGGKSSKRMLAVVALASVTASISPMSLALAGTFKDVQSDAVYSNAAERLYDLGLITGTDKNMFEPDKVLNRATAATMIERLVTGQKGDLKKSNTNFSDVAQNYWASGNIKNAVKLKLIEGYSKNGKIIFEPQKNVSIAEFTVMTLRALGYNPKNNVNGKWYINAVKQAQDLGIIADSISDFTAPIKKADAAIMESKALDTKIYKGEVFYKHIRSNIRASVGIIGKTGQITGKLTDNNIIIDGISYKAVLNDSDMKKLGDASGYRISYDYTKGNTIVYAELGDKVPEPANSSQGASSGTTSTPTQTPTPSPAPAQTPSNQNTSPGQAVSTAATINANTVWDRGYHNFTNGDLTIGSSGVTVEGSTLGSAHTWNDSTYVDGNIVINADNVTLKNIVVSGNITLASGVGNGTVYLDNVYDTNGKLIILSAGPNSAQVKGSSCFGEVDINDNDGNARLLAQDEGGNSPRIGSVQVSSGCLLEDDTANKKAFTGNVGINVLNPAQTGNGVTIDSPISGAVSVQGTTDDMPIKLQQPVDTLSVNKGLNSAPQLFIQSKVNNLTANSPVAILLGDTSVVTTLSVNSSKTTINALGDSTSIGTLNIGNGGAAPLMTGVTNIGDVNNSSSSSNVSPYDAAISLKFDDIKGANTDSNSVTSDLDLSKVTYPGGIIQWNVYCDHKIAYIDGNTVKINKPVFTSIISVVAYCHKGQDGASMCFSLKVPGSGNADIEAKIREVLNKPLTSVGNLTQSDLQSIKSLDLSGLGLTNLSGLDQLTELQSLNLDGNAITDLTPVAGLTKLQDLSVAENNISDVSPLNGLTSLSSLNLWGNNIKDIASLKNLINLDYLDLDQNDIRDLTPLSGLTKLKYLNLDENTGIKNITPLNSLTSLETLNLRDIDINPLPVMDGQIDDAYSLLGNGTGNSWGAVVNSVYATSDGSNLYLAVYMNPKNSGNNLWLMLDDTNMNSGLTDLSGDAWAGYGNLGITNNAGANIDYVIDGWRDGSGIFNLGNERTITNFSAGYDKGCIDHGTKTVTVAQKTDYADGSAVYEFKIPYSSIGTGAKNGDIIKPYILFGKDANKDHPDWGGIRSIFPAQTDTAANPLSVLDKAPAGITLIDDPMENLKTSLSNTDINVNDEN